MGEEIASKFLERKGYKIVERNYLRKWGELDIVAEKSKKIYFVEVKTVSRETIEDFSRETSDSYRAEDNLHPWKLKRLSRVIQTYMGDRDIEWQFDVITVLLSLDKRQAKVLHLEDIIL